MRLSVMVLGWFRYLRLLIGQFVSAAAHGHVLEAIGFLFRFLRQADRGFGYLFLWHFCTYIWYVPLLYSVLCMISTYLWVMFQTSLFRLFKEIGLPGSRLTRWRLSLTFESRLWRIIRYVSALKRLFKSSIVIIQFYLLLCTVVYNVRSTYIRIYILHRCSVLCVQK